jgi:hypothetical protein
MYENNESSSDKNMKPRHKRHFSRMKTWSGAGAGHRDIKYQRGKNVRIVHHADKYCVMHYYLQESIYARVHSLAEFYEYLRTSRIASEIMSGILCENSESNSR